MIGFAAGAIAGGVAGGILGFSSIWLHGMDFSGAPGVLLGAFFGIVIGTGAGTIAGFVLGSVAGFVTGLISELSRIYKVEQELDPSQANSVCSGLSS